MGKAPLPLNKRNCYPPYPDHYLKTSIWGSRKSDIVSKSLVLVKNLDISSSFLFWPIKIRKSVWYPVPDRKQAILSFQNSSVRKSKIWHFLKELVHGLVKNLKFIHPFFLGQIGLEKVFGAVLDGKQAILAFKNNNLRKSKISHFLKELVHGFGQKFEIYSSFLFWSNKLRRSVWCCSG